MKISIRDEYDSFYGDDCVASPGSDWYPYGETVSFTATPGAEFYFDQWGSDTGFDLPYYLDSFRYQPTISFRVEEPLSLVFTDPEINTTQLMMITKEKALPKAKIAKGTFNSDLFYRLNIINIHNFKS